jgi:hypothetical protein
MPQRSNGRFPNRSPNPTAGDSGTEGGNRVGVFVSVAQNVRFVRLDRQQPAARLRFLQTQFCVGGVNDVLAQTDPLGLVKQFEYDASARACTLVRGAPAVQMRAHSSRNASAISCQWISEIAAFNRSVYSVAVLANCDYDLAGNLDKLVFPGAMSGITSTTA